MSLSAYKSTRAQRGFSLVELMVGITIGLIVVAGASMLMVNQLGEHSRLTQETQVQQDLRAAADLMLRDLRRAGFWAAPDQGVYAIGAAAPINDPYTLINACNITASSSQVSYAYSSTAKNYLASPGQAPDSSQASYLEDNLVDGGSEVFGFQIANQTLSFLLGCKNGVANWQPLTDPNSVLIVAPSSIKTVVQTVDLQGYCAKPCPVGYANCPYQEIRRYEITLTGQSTHDSTVVRTITVTSRQRNDRIVGACPP